MRFSHFSSCTVFAVLAQAYTPAPVALPSSEWSVIGITVLYRKTNSDHRLGIDGNWSTVTLQLGSNSQAVDVLVSTALSEFWAVDSGGCVSGTSLDLFQFSPPIISFFVFSMDFVVFLLPA